jgi:L-ascorbate metabolism protein UlaG (beta-lactamase superfamily)
MTVIVAGQQIDLAGIHIKAVDAYNRKKSSTGKIWHSQGSGVGYLIVVEDKQIYHAGDTDFIPEMKQLGPVDLALLPIGGTYTMVIPMHHLKANPQNFKKKIETNSDIHCAVLKIGESYCLS